MNEKRQVLESLISDDKRGALITDGYVLFRLALGALLDENQGDEKYTYRNTYLRDAKKVFLGEFDAISGDTDIEEIKQAVGEIYERMDIIAQEETYIAMKAMESAA